MMCFFFAANPYQNGLCSVPEVSQSTSEIRIQVFTINAKNLEFWNHFNLFNPKNRMREKENSK